MSNSSSEVTAQCSHCGLPLSPTHIGPCPRCGKVGKTIKVSLHERVRIREEIRASVTKAFAARNIPVPDQLPEVIEEIGTVSISRLEDALNRVLDQRDRAKEAKEKSIRERLRSFFFAVIWILIGILLGRVVSLLFPTG
jgi:hypothetical protein